VFDSSAIMKFCLLSLDSKFLIKYSSLTVILFETKCFCCFLFCVLNCLSILK